MTQYLLLLSLLSTTSFFSVLRAQQPSQTIIGGNFAEDAEFPYIVSIQLKRTTKLTHHCGGSIIATSWILTAAHCLEHRISRYKIVAGITKLSDTDPGRQERTIAESIIHPKYSEALEVLLNDIALIKLDKPLEFNRRVQAIKLPEPGHDLYGEAVAIGWGTANAEVIQYSNTLKKITVIVLATKVCMSLIPPPFQPKNHICTSPGLIEGACFGDSGGTLIQYNEIIGVASFVRPECGKTAVYARVSSYIDFIKEYVQN